MENSRFLTAFQMSKTLVGDIPVLNDSLAASVIRGLFLGVYNDGVYTLLPRSEAEPLAELLPSVFPVAKGKVTVFAADWMGRLFVTDTSELDATGAATVVCFDLAEPSSFTTEVNFDDFHNLVAVD